MRVELNHQGYIIANMLFAGYNINNIISKLSKNNNIELNDIYNFIHELKHLRFMKEHDGYNNWTVEWDITYECNLNCKHCMVNAGNSLDNELTYEECKNLVDELFDNHFKIIVFSGGEPLIKPYFYKLLKYIYNKGFIVKILTNACLINDSIAKYMSQCNVIYAQVSLDGHNKEQHEHIRGANTFYSMLRGVESLKKSNINFGMAMVLTNDNYYYLEDTINCAIKCGASAFSSGALVQAGRALYAKLMAPTIDSNKLDMICYKLAVKYAKSINYNNYISTIIRNIKLEEEGYSFNACSRISNGIAVSPNGEISFCKGFFGKCDLANTSSNVSFVLGKYPQESLKDILNKRNKYNFDVVDNSYDCQKCEYIKYCKGGCPAEVYSKYGKFKIPINKCNQKERYKQLKNIIDDLMPNYAEN